MATKRKSIIPLLPSKAALAEAAATAFSSSNNNSKSVTRADTILLKIFDCIAFLYELGRPLGRRVVEKCIHSPQFKEIFDQHDTDGSGTLDADELYTVVLQFYLLVAQWTFVIAKHVPSRKDVLSIITHADVNDDGLIGFDEFKDVMVLLCHGVATQLVAQTIFTVFLAPLLSVGLLVAIKRVFALLPSLAAQFWFVPGFLCNDKVGIMLFVPLCNCFLLPYYLEYIFYIQSLRNPSKVRFVPDMSQFELVKSPLSKKKNERNVEKTHAKECTEEVPELSSPLVDECPFEKDETNKKQD